MVGKLEDFSVMARPGYLQPSSAGGACQQHRKRGQNVPAGDATEPAPESGAQGECS